MSASEWMALGGAVGIGLGAAGCLLWWAAGQRARWGRIPDMPRPVPAPRPPLPSGLTCTRVPGPTTLTLMVSAAGDVLWGVYAHSGPITEAQQERLADTLRGWRDATHKGEGPRILVTGDVEVRIVRGKEV